MDSILKAVSTIKDRITRTPLERLVCDACTDENWGVPNTALQEIAERTFSTEDRQAIMKIVWELLRSPPKEWRRLYKVLNLIEQLLMFGSTACMSEIQNEVFKIRTLQDFSFRENSEEKGIGIRDKSRYLSGLLADRRTLEEEREKAKKIRNKLSGGLDGGSNFKRYDSYDSYSSKDHRAAETSQEYRHDYSNKDQKKDIAEFGQFESAPKLVKSGSVSAPTVDIFKAPEIKASNPEPQMSLWHEPAIKPTSGKVIKPPPSFTAPAPSVFDQPSMKTSNPPAFPVFPAVTAAPNLQIDFLSMSVPADSYKQPAVIPKSSNILPTDLFTSFTPAPPLASKTSPVFSSPPSSGLDDLWGEPVHVAPQRIEPPRMEPPRMEPPRVEPARIEPVNNFKVNIGFGDSGTTMAQMKNLGLSGFSDFQSAAPVKKEPEDLESRLFNLDNLTAGQPKPKEVPKARW